MNDLAGVVRLAIEEIWNQGALELADCLFAPDYINHGGLIPDLVRGPEAIKVSVASYRLAFPALQIAVEDLTSEGERVTLRWVARSTPAGDGIANGSAEPQRSLVGMTVSRFAGGQIAESWTDWNAEGKGNELDLFLSLLDHHDGDLS
ncbi:MAG: ester cyclase [Thermomicrobiales bacterium]